MMDPDDEDDLRIEHVAALLEENDQQDLAEYWRLLQEDTEYWARLRRESEPSP